MDLVVVIPTCEHLGYAYRALVSLGKCTPDVRWKAILVDDASRQWDGERWSKWPLDNVIRHHFPTRKGLTRSWNFGIEKAEALKARYTVVTNSDVLFSAGWFQSLRTSLDSNSLHLVGPLTNAPGHRPKQLITEYVKDYEADDSQKAIDSVAAYLREKYPNQHKEARVNGFMMMAKTSVWRDGAFSKEAVFNPAKPLTGNEDELQKRWLKKGMKVGFSLDSFIFHYRSVSRKAGRSGPVSRGMYRPDTR